jgi:histidinol-phosphate aminotransferase
VIGWLDRVRDSYNVNRLSQVAAIAALQDQAYHAQIVARIKATRDRCQAGWSQGRGWFTYRSSANFIFTEPRNARGESGPAVAKAAYEALLANRVLVRYFPNHALTASFLRVSVGTDDEMGRLNSTLDAWLKQSDAA